MLANLQGVEPSASVRVGFVDVQVARLVGVDGLSEYPLVLVVWHGSGTGGDDGAVADISAIEDLDLAVEAISRAPIEFPLVTKAQHDGDLADPAAVERWRTTASSLGAPALAAAEPPGAACDDPIETVILRRGSTRLMRRETVGRDLLTRELGTAARVVPGDVAPAGGTLLQHFVSVHDVEGVAPGAYRWHGDRLHEGREGSSATSPRTSASTSPSAATPPTPCSTQAISTRCSARWAGAATAPAQLEAGIAAGRLALAAFTLGDGATGLTFYDEAVSQHFATQAACMLVTSVGVADYRNTPGGRPGAPTELARFQQLMERLSLQLHRRRFEGGSEWIKRRRA
jgi:hypothetical protein